MEVGRPFQRRRTYQASEIYHREEEAAYQSEIDLDSDDSAVVIPVKKVANGGAYLLLRCDL